MGIWTGHDLNNDGTPDLFIQHSKLDDPHGFAGVFLLLFLFFTGLFWVVFSIFGPPNQNAMTVPMFSILGGSVVSLLFTAKATMGAAYPWGVPVVALLLVGGGGTVLQVQMKLSDAKTEQKKQVDEQKQQQLLEEQKPLIYKKLAANDKRGYELLKRVSDYAEKRGWKEVYGSETFTCTVGNAGFSEYTRRFVENPSKKSDAEWGQASAVPDGVIVSYNAVRNDSRGYIRITIVYTTIPRSCIVSATTDLEGKQNYLEEAYSKIHHNTNYGDSYEIHNVKFDDLKSNKLKTIVQEWLKSME
ncbi:MAG: hypothetical protein C0467_30740 [Planctomycetaceae bacterium]|nr:hypothetical protein [Planctomycetaceae bacterium]